MTGEEILVAVAAGLLALGIIAVIVRFFLRFRYIWSEGYFRIVLYNQDKHITGTVQKLIGVTSFNLEVEGFKHRFEILPEMIFTSGRFKVRTLHYVLGDLKPKGTWIPVVPKTGKLATPISPLDDDPPDGTEDRSSTEFHTVANNRVMQHLMESFQSSALSGGLGILLIGLVVIVGFVILGVVQNQQIETLKDEFIAAQPTPQTRFESPGVGNNGPLGAP